MKSLLCEINKDANRIVTECAIIEQNLCAAAKHLSVTDKHLDEGVTHWLNKIEHNIPKLKNSDDENARANLNRIITILGILEGLTNPDLAATLDKKMGGSLGEILANIGSTDKTQNANALRSIEQLAHAPSMLSFIERSNDVMQSDDSERAIAFIKNIRFKIDRVINARLHANKSNPNTASQQVPQQQSSA